MKKGFVLLLSLLLITMAVPGMAFAEEGVNEEYIAEKVDEAFALAASVDGDVTLRMMPDGSGYAKEVYDLGDGCTLTMEFEDGSDGLKSFVSGNTAVIMPLATNGETLWKAYGARYFTAKATVTVGLWQGSLSLENHYTLSEEGIDERYGVANYSSNGSSVYTSIESGQPVITDSSARTVGASDVNMYVDFVITDNNADSILTKSVRLSTTVGYVAHNYTTEQIQVKHSWSLS